MARIHLTHKVSPLGRLLTLLVLAGCERPNGPAVIRTAPIPPAVTRLTLAEFVPVAAWPWDGPSECANVPPELILRFDTSAAYVITLVAPSRATPRSHLHLEFDQAKRLLVYDDLRAYAYDSPRETVRMTNVHIRLKTPWGRPIAGAVNYRYRPDAPDERVGGSPEDVYYAPLLGASGRVLRLALERCGVGPGFTTPFDRR